MIPLAQAIAQYGVDPGLSLGRKAYRHRPCHAIMATGRPDNRLIIHCSGSRQGVSLATGINFREVFRPREARWFELYVPRDDTVYAIEALAGTGEVQLESSTHLASPLDVAKIRNALAELDHFCKIHQIALPAYAVSPSRLLTSPEETAEQALASIRHWGERLVSLQEQMHKLQSEKEDLDQLLNCLKALHEDDTGLELFAHHGDFLYKGIYACPRDHPLNPRLDDTICRTFVQGDTEFLLLAADPEQQAAIDQLVENSACVEIKIPEWLPSGRSAQETAVAERLSAVKKLYHKLQLQIEAHWASDKLKSTLANVAILRWFLSKASKVAERGRFCRVTGWSTLPDPSAVESVLKNAHINAVVRHPLPPPSSLPPVHILETWWSRPFHLFKAFSGTPGKNEINPALIIPLVVPLLFGFMFPDAGHGLMLLAFGLLFGLKYPQLRFLAPCGVASIIFGLLFGELFGIEGVLPVIWFRPLDEPLRVLAVSLLIGCGLILTGMLFSAIEAKWRGALREWFAADAPVMGLYIAAVLAVFQPSALLVMPFLLLWYLGGSALYQHRRGKINPVGIIGRLLQSGFELLLHNFSFIRIGAFALAHAGLTTTVVMLADDMQNGASRLAVLLTGHLLVAGIEGLVVFIQTTRLIFFEFFINFLRADGRPLKPLSLPDQA